ncbi:hypothetical protein CDD83_8877 [Cordyceps sp. RAO-2017]|nr:hypothetical protein CDD83_8877 [Cordyceps sp. RAO-2017]
MTLTTCALLALALSLRSASAQPSGPRAVEVEVEAGRLAGSASASVSRFFGIPFAAPPIRFNAPEPARAWEGVYDATKHKPACVQKFSYPEDRRNRSMQWFNTPPPPAGESEDCLYLDIYAPAGAAPGCKAVMFWLFGGGFSFGSGSLPQYDGSSFAADQDVVVVAPNYRTNVFGFPGSPEKPESEQNLGFLDQRLALDWVQRNIHAFGGDPNRVTLFGESAGSGSVEILVNNPPRPVPFAGAIMQSGQSSIALSDRSSAASWKKLTKAAGCETDGALECMRAVPADKLKALVEHGQLKFAPIHDGNTTYTSTGRVDRLSSTEGSSKIARVPVMIGSDADDGGPFVYGMTDAGATLKRLLPAGAAGVVDKILSAYPLDGLGLGPVNKQLSAIFGDFAFTCPAKVVAEDSASVGIPTWRYFFDAGFANTEAYPGSGAWHSSEIGLVYGTYPREGATAYQAAVSRAMQKAWADFAKDPFAGPGWDPVPRVSVFGGGVRARAGPANSSAHPVMEVGKAGHIDRRCFLYKPIYKAAMRSR